MTVEPEGDRIVLVPESDDEIKLAACIVEAIRTGGWVRAVAPGLGGIQLQFDGDTSQVLADPLSDNVN